MPINCCLTESGDVIPNTTDSHPEKSDGILLLDTAVTVFNNVQFRLRDYLQDIIPEDQINHMRIMLRCEQTSGVYFSAGLKFHTLTKNPHTRHVDTKTYTHNSIKVCIISPKITQYVCPIVILLLLRYVTRQLFGKFRADQFISKLSIIVTVYEQI